MVQELSATKKTQKEESARMKRIMEHRKTIEIINELRALGFTVEESLQSRILYK